MRTDDRGRNDTWQRHPLFSDNNDDSEDDGTGNAIIAEKDVDLGFVSMDLEQMNWCCLTLQTINQRHTAARGSRCVRLAD